VRVFLVAFDILALSLLNKAKVSFDDSNKSSTNRDTEYRGQ